MLQLGEALGEPSTNRMGVAMRPHADNNVPGCSNMQWGSWTWLHMMAQAILVIDYLFYDAPQMGPAVACPN